MANLVRLLRQWPTLHHHCCVCATHHHFLSSALAPVTKTASFRVSLITVPSAFRNAHHRSRGVRLPNALIPSDLEEANTSDSDPDVRKSRNQLKREAQRAVRWGMDLASFSLPQIKRILRAASLDEDVLEALTIVKRLGPDVREGKRRQFSYIGKLLREVQAELMDSLIQATKDGDHSRLQALSGPAIIGDEDEEAEDTESDEEELGSDKYIDIATRWFEGLINKDTEITKEIYSIHSIEFDRQELRKLVRRVHSTQEQQAGTAENEKGDAAVISARRSLTRFLRALAKKMPSDQSFVSA